MSGKPRDGSSIHDQSRARTRRALWALAVGGPFGAFVALGARAAADEEIRWDSAVADAVAAIAPTSSSEVHVDPVLTATTLGLGAFAAILAITLLVTGRRRGALFLVLAIGGAVALSRIAKVVVERPPIEGDRGDYSFPSGTATWSMAIAVALGLLARSVNHRRLVALAGGVLVLGFGWVIVWEEWHYPSDVVAGWCLAVAWVATLWLALRPTARQNARPDS